jgi:polyisoprenoid-binding protein YceI
MNRMTKFGAFAAVGALGVFLLGNVPAPTAQAQTPAAAVAVTPLTGNWTIDPMHTNVNFGIGHLGISTVRGHFVGVSGEIVADAKRPENSSVQVTIKVDSINTGVEMRDTHLKSPDFFDAAKYPEITFKSTRITKAKRGFVAQGDLTMHGVTRQISLPFAVKGPVSDGRGPARIGAETQIKLNRRDYGMTYGSLLPNGAMDVANTVDVTISLEAVPTVTPQTP